MFLKIDAPPWVNNKVGRQYRTLKSPYMRFTIRDWFWFTVVVAMGLAWWADRKTWPAFRDRENLTKAVSDAGFYFDRNETGKGYKLVPYPPPYSHKYVPRYPEER